MSDTWSDIQALKSRQSSMRERLARRKKEREGLVADITGQSQAVSTAAAAATSSSSATSVKKGIDICNICYYLKLNVEMRNAHSEGLSYLGEIRQDFLSA